MPSYCCENPQDPARRQKLHCAGQGKVKGSNSHFNLPLILPKVTKKTAVEKAKELSLIACCPFTRFLRILLHLVPESGKVKNKSEQRRQMCLQDDHHQ